MKSLEQYLKNKFSTWDLDIKHLSTPCSLSKWAVSEALLLAGWGPIYRKYCYYSLYIDAKDVGTAFFDFKETFWPNIHIDKNLDNGAWYILLRDDKNCPAHIAIYSKGA